MEGKGMTFDNIAQEKYKMTAEGRKKK